MAVPPSAEFVGRAARVIDYLRRSYPDQRARDLLSGQPILVYGAASEEDMRLAGTYGSAVGPEDVLLGLHVGGVGQMGEIRIYEDGIRTAAQRRGISVEQQLDATLRHESEHSAGACPSGHLDCSQAEVARTYEMGGWLDPEQVAAYSARGYALPASVHAQVLRGCGCGHR